METAVDRVELFGLACKLPETIGSAVRFFDRRETLLVRLTTRGGAVGLGETWAMPAAAAALIQTALGPALLGEAVRYPQKIWRKLSRFIVNDRRGLTGIQRMARASDFQPQSHLVMATVILAMLPPVLVVAAMQRQFVKGLFETEK